MNQADDLILNAMTILLERYQASAPFDRTVRGRIISQLDSKHYLVEMQGSQYKIPVYGSSSFSPNEIVWICIPENNFNNKFLLPK